MGIPLITVKVETGFRELMAPTTEVQKKRINGYAWGISTN